MSYDTRIGIVKKGENHMSEEKKKDIFETVLILKQLDRSSLLLIKNGAELLKARQDMEVIEKQTA